PHMKTAHLLLLTPILALNTVVQNTVELDPRLQRLDRNSDGQLSKDEIPAALVPFFTKRKADADGNGVITAQEAAKLSLPKRNRQNQPGGGENAKKVTPNQSAVRPHGEEAKVAGLNPEVLAELDAVLQGNIDAKHVSGVIGLIHRNGHRGYFEAFGWQDIAAEKPMPKDAIFRLKSMSKPVVAVAALVLFDDGAFALDDPISKHCPEWAEPKVLKNDGSVVPAKTAITPRMLMSHSSGLYYNLPDKPAFSGMPPRTEDTNLEEYSRAIAKQPLFFHPGEGYRYGTSIDILGRYVEAVSKKPLDVFVRERIFEPLGMNDTDFWVPDPKQDRLAELYKQSPSGELSPASERFPPTKPTKLFMGGAGLLSTTVDYERFCRMILGHGELDGARILKSETVDLMFQNHLKPKLGQTYGLGGAVDGEGGYSWGGANGTKFKIDRSNQLIAVFMVQTQRYKAPTYNDFQRLVNRAVGL
ncbi:MAG: serine hydrolase domain-containing protein, partial [Verrucomicrobiota bacterium]